MKALKIAGFVILGIIVLFLIVALLQPSHGHVEKTIVINAQPSAVYTQVNSLKKMNTWSPWAKMDPGAKFVFEGPESGVGAKMSWDGEKTGKGTQWIEESEENKRVKNGLSFQGFEATSYSEIVLTPEGEATKVTWSYDGENQGIAPKAMWVFMKGALEGQFTDGLKDLKTVVESNPMPASVEADSTSTSDIK